MARAWRRLDFGIPHVKDVGAAALDEHPFDGKLEPIWFVGSDGSLWFLSVPFSAQCQQVASPGDLTRVAVSPDGTIWCADSRGVLWMMRDNSWSIIDVPTEKVKDVSVSSDKTVWLVMENGRYYSILPGGVPVFHGVFIIIEAISGIAGPNDVHPFGRAWGVSPMFGPSVLCQCKTINGWSSTNIQNVHDLSLDEFGTLWMSKSDGTIWTTTDGATQVVTGGAGFTRVSGNISGLAWAVSSDGSAWVWHETDITPAATPPPPPPSPPAPQGAPPFITVTALNGGLSTIFRVTGSGFLPNVQVTIRGARIDQGQIHQFYWLATSVPAPDGTGMIQQDIALPCIPGIVISFSANDGRSNPADLTDRLWSNTFQATCPPG